MGETGLLLVALLCANDGAAGLEVTTEPDGHASGPPTALAATVDSRRVQVTRLGVTP